MASKQDIIQQWYQQVWANGDLDRIGDLYRPAPDAACLIPGATIPPTDTREMISVMHSMLADQTVRVIHSVEQGDWVSALVEMRGFKQGTTTPVALRWLVLLRIEADRIVESYPSVNFLSLFEQLGQLPDHALELLLGGTVLR